MQVGDKEFYELQSQFEEDMHGERLDREDIKTVPVGIFYQDGTVNNLFRAYMMGYENAKCLNRLEQQEAQP